jgi:hypothetical protein
LSDALRPRLDHAETLDPGRGRFEFGLVANDFGIGGSLSVEHRVNRALSMFGEGSIFYDKSWGWQTLAGLRLRW